MASIQKPTEHIPADCILRVVEHHFTFSPEHWEHFRTCDVCVDNFAEFLRVLRHKRQDLKSDEGCRRNSDQDVRGTSR